MLVFFFQRSMASKAIHGIFGSHIMPWTEIEIKIFAPARSGLNDVKHLFAPLKCSYSNRIEKYVA